MPFVIDLYVQKKILQETTQAAPQFIQTLTQPTELFIAFVTLETNRNDTCSPYTTHLPIDSIIAKETTWFNQEFHVF